MEGNRRRQETAQDRAERGGAGWMSHFLKSGRSAVRPAPDHSLSPANLCMWPAVTPVSRRSHGCPLMTIPDL